MTDNNSELIETEGDYPTCTVKCSKITGPDGATCQKTCCKKATPEHESYGTHYCSDHK